MKFHRYAATVGIASMMLAAATSLAHAKGSPPPSPCSISYLNCPTIISNTSGSLVDELINNTFDAATLGIAYSVPQLPSGDSISFTLSGPGTGANLLPFIATAKLSAYDVSSGSLLFTLAATNFDPSGSGGSGYLGPTTLTQNGITLTESGSGFEGDMSFQAIDPSGAPVKLLLDLNIRANGYGQVTVTNTYAVTAVPEPLAGIEWAVGLIVLSGAAGRRRLR